MATNGAQRSQIDTLSDALGAIERVEPGTAAARIARIALAAVAMCAVTACGGGDCDAQCLKDHGPVDCTAQPEACT